MAPKGPYKLVTVNTAPERAKRLIGRVVEDLKDQYTIQHVANCESMSALYHPEAHYVTLLGFRICPAKSIFDSRLMVYLY